MHGSNGSPMVEFPEDRIGPTAAAPNQSFYVYSPTIHWHTVQSEVVDLQARKVVERLADEAYKFGLQVEEHERLLLDGQHGVENFVKEEIGGQRETIRNLQAAMKQQDAEILALKDKLRLLRVHVTTEVNAVEQRQESALASVESRVARKFEREGPKVVAMEEKVMNMEGKCLKRC